MAAQTITIRGWIYIDTGVHASLPFGTPYRFVPGDRVDSLGDWIPVEPHTIVHELGAAAAPVATSGAAQ